MKFLEGTTEGLVTKEKWVDKLSTLDSINCMLESQENGLIVIRKSIENIKIVIDNIYTKLKENNDSRIIYVGAGTSGRIAVQDGAELYPTFGWPKSRLEFIIAGGKEALTESIENAEDNLSFALKEINKINISKEDVVIGLTASGNTPFTLEVIKKSREIGALTIGISNNKGSRLEKISSFSIVLNTGPEIIQGSTRLTAGTTQKVLLNIISTIVMSRLGLVKNGVMVNLKATNKKLLKRKKIIDNFLKIMK